MAVDRARWGATANRAAQKHAQQRGGEGLTVNHPAYVAPITYRGDPSVAMARLGGVLQRMGGVTLIRVEPTYLYAECRTKTMRFVDDFEARIDPANHVIHIRSASRLRRSDLGVNRARAGGIGARTVRCSRSG